MRVKVRFETADFEGMTDVSEVTAVLSEDDKGYRLTYVEDLAGDGNKTKSELLVSADGLRIIRKGQIDSDFIYGNGVTCNTFYRMPYGGMPVTVETTDYEYHEVLGDYPDITVKVEYVLIFHGQEPMNMKIKININ